MKNSTLTLIVFAIVGLFAAAATIILRIQNPKEAGTFAERSDSVPSDVSTTEKATLRLGKTARKNLQLVSKPAIAQDYWKTLQIPGILTDRPGFSDRGVTAPAVGVVTEIHAFEGDTVSPGDRLFTLRLISEYLQNTQAELFQAIRESQLIEEQRQRLAGAVKSGAISEARLIELENNSRRQAAAIQGYRQDLLTRGLSPEQIEAIADGNFVSTIDVRAPVPPARVLTSTTSPSLDATTPELRSNMRYEVQELKAEIGKQVQAGELLSLLSNHQHLYIEGHAFKREASTLSAAAEAGTPIRVEFTEDDSQAWPPLENVLTIRHLANMIDPESRTFSFFVPLVNQSRSYEKSGQSFTLWRFRPGQRVRLFVPIERMANVFVLPTSAVAQEGPEAFVFQQNGDLFDRISVQVMYQDRSSIVIANDGKITPGLYLAQNSAAALNRVLKSQLASGTKVNIHVHADGSVHENH